MEKIGYSAIVEKEVKLMPFTAKILKNTHSQWKIQVKREYNETANETKFHNSTAVFILKPSIKRGPCVCW